MLFADAVILFRSDFPARACPKATSFNSECQMLANPLFLKVQKWMVAIKLTVCKHRQGKGLPKYPSFLLTHHQKSLQSGSQVKTRLQINQQQNSYSKQYRIWTVWKTAAKLLTGTCSNEHIKIKKTFRDFQFLSKHSSESLSWPSKSLIWRHKYLKEEEV